MKTSLIFNFILEKPGYIVKKAINQDGRNEMSGLDVMLLDEEWKSDRQKTLNRDCNRCITRSSQHNLEDNKSITSHAVQGVN